MKKGNYVVFLSVSGKSVPFGYNNLPTDYVYRLKEDFKSNYFLVQKDMNKSISNGYTSNNIEVRPASSEEIYEYIINDGPVPAIVNEFQLY